MYMWINVLKNKLLQNISRVPSKYNTLILQYKCI